MYSNKMSALHGNANSRKQEKSTTQEDIYRKHEAKSKPEPKEWAEMTWFDASTTTNITILQTTFRLLTLHLKIGSLLSFHPLHDGYSKFASLAPDFASPTELSDLQSHLNGGKILLSLPKAFQSFSPGHIFWLILWRSVKK